MRGHNQDAQDKRKLQNAKSTSSTYCYTCAEPGHILAPDDCPPKGWVRQSWVETEGRLFATSDGQICSVLDDFHHPLPLTYLFAFQKHGPPRHFNPQHPHYFRYERETMRLWCGASDINGAKIRTECEYNYEVFETHPESFLASFQHDLCCTGSLFLRLSLGRNGMMEFRAGN